MLSPASSEVIKCWPWWLLSKQVTAGVPILPGYGPQDTPRGHMHAVCCMALWLCSGCGPTGSGSALIGLQLPGAGLARRLQRICFLPGAGVGGCRSTSGAPCDLWLCPL